MRTFIKLLDHIFPSMGYLIKLDAEAIEEYTKKIEALCVERDEKLLPCCREEMRVAFYSGRLSERHRK